MTAFNNTRFEQINDVMPQYGLCHECKQCESHPLPQLELRLPEEPLSVFGRLWILMFAVKHTNSIIAKGVILKYNESKTNLMRIPTHHHPQKVEEYGMVNVLISPMGRIHPMVIPPILILFGIQPKHCSL